MKYSLAAAALFAATAHANQDVDLSGLTDSLKDLGVDTIELEVTMSDLASQLESMMPSAE